MSAKKVRTTAATEQPKVARLCVLDPDFRADLEWWVTTKPRVASKLITLMEAVLRDPFDGIGKPEPLKQLASNIWSRRLTEEHRIVCVVHDDRIVFVQGRYHY
jgi:toxin YoeB